MSKFLYCSGASSVSGAFASTPDSASISITGSIDIRVKAACASWASGTQTLLSIRNNGATDAWAFRVESAGTIQFFWWDSGGTIRTPGASSVSTGLSAYATKWIRCTMDATTGTVTYYTGDDGSTWTQLGTTKTISAATTIRDTAFPLRIGSNAGTVELLTGKVFKAEIRNGIAGTVVASPDFTAQTLDAATFNDTQGNTWTMAGGGAILDDGSGGGVSSARTFNGF